MGVGYNTKTVTNGLVGYWDARNTKSYSGSGTTWTDLSGNAYNATLAGTGLTYSSGSFVYTGDTTAQFYLPNSGFFSIATNNMLASSGYAWTVSVWFNFPTSPTTTRTGNQSYSLGGMGGGIGGAETFNLFVGSGTDSTYGSYVPYYCAIGISGTKTIISPASVNTSTWNNVVVTYNGSSGRAYFNGVDRGALNIGAAAVQTGYYFGIGSNSINGPGTFTNPGHVFEGSISNFQVYNRGISSEEVLQNYNALKGRFGL